MLNQTSTEALYSATYVENYLDVVENLPGDLQRQLTRLRELDVTYRTCLRDVQTYLELCSSTEANPSATARERQNRHMSRVRKALIQAQDIGDEKLQVVQTVQDLIDNKARSLDGDYRKLISCIEVNSNGASKEDHTPPESSQVRDKDNLNIQSALTVARATPPSATPPHNQEKDKDKDREKTGERAPKRTRRGRHETTSDDRDDLRNNANKKGKKKKRKTRGQSTQARSETPPPEETIDPDEPRYCLCDQISYGEMILCDNDLCPIEWFHFSCVLLTTKPKGKWFCPKCRGDRPNVMKPKGQFLKELERYNREKEEKV